MPITLPPASLLVLGSAQHVEEAWKNQNSSEGARVIDLTPLGATQAEREANGRIALERAGARRQNNPVEVLPDGVVRIRVVENADHVSRVVFASLREIRSQLKEEAQYNIDRYSLNADLTRLYDAVRDSRVGQSVTGQVAVRVNPSASYEIECAEDAQGLTGLVLRRRGSSFSASLEAQPDAVEAANVAALAGAVERQGAELRELKDAINVLSAGLTAAVQHLSALMPVESAAKPRRTKAESPEQAA